MKVKEFIEGLGGKVLIAHYGETKVTDPPYYIQLVD